jgi:hypothetical protein
MKFAGKGEPLTRAGLNKALDIRGRGLNDAAYIWTVIEVETASLTQGFGCRRPKILFERNIFCKRTDACFDSEAPDISGPAGGYGTLAEQYAKLEKAIALCARAKLGIEPALESTSWGLGQVMGFNHAVAVFTWHPAWLRQWFEVRTRSLLRWPHF